MALGDITYKCVKITCDETTGYINYAKEKYIEDSDGVLQKIGTLIREGGVPPRKRNSDDTGWIDNVITDKPQCIQDIASGLWTSARKTAYENANS